MGLAHTVTKDRKIYGNCKVYSPDGHLMFRCDDKRANWYISRNLANVISHTPYEIKLNFQPKGLGNHNKNYGLTKIENKCVVCGTDEFLTRHHVVPYCYRRYFPVENKSHQFHDVLSLCVDCHENYEYSAFEFKKELAERYSAPINGELFNNKDMLKMRKIAVCLTSDWLKFIPKERVDEMKSTIRTFFSWKRITNKRLNNLIEKELKVLNKTHGEIVISKLNDLKPFVKEWRLHFLNNNECKYLPENWSVENE